MSTGDSAPTVVSSATSLALASTRYVSRLGSTYSRASSGSASNCVANRSLPSARLSSVNFPDVSSTASASRASIAH